MSSLMGVNGEDDRCGDECQLVSYRRASGPHQYSVHHPTGDRKPGKAFTSLTVLVGEWEGQLPSRIRPGKIGRSQISALDITRGRPVKWYIAVPMSVGLDVTSHM